MHPLDQAINDIQNQLDNGDIDAATASLKKTALLTIYRLQNLSNYNKKGKAFAIDQATLLIQKLAQV